MDYAVSSGGVLVHGREDWPCAVCRPQEIAERRGFWMCLHCAHGVIIAAEAGVAGARALLDDITDALVRLEAPAAQHSLLLH